MKQSQRGAISAVLLVVALLGAALAIFAVSYISASNRGNQMEKAIEATYEDNQQKLGQYGQRILEAAQVTDMARDDLLKVVREAISGRYGENGSQAVFQAINEQNPTVDPELYRKLQQLIESGRREFQDGQTRLIDQKRVYTTALGTFWGGMFMRMAGYPKIDLNKYQAITTDRAAQVFEAGKESAPIQLRAPAK